MLLESLEHTQPVIKWVGGKRSLLPEILPRIGKSGFTGTYLEPFIGGGAVFFSLAPKSSVISDLNPNLIHFYKSVRSDNALLEQITEDSYHYGKLSDEEKQNFFYSARARFNQFSFDTRHASDFYLLNKLGFNGLYRENSAGLFNTPFGRRATLPIPDKRNWSNAQKILLKTTIENQSFEVTSSRAVRGDFVYFDPPYIPLTATASFTSYSSDGFGIEMQNLLAEVCRNLDKSNVKFLLSNSNTDLTREIFSNFTFTEISAQRLVGATAASRNSVSELLISNYQQQ